MSRLCSRATLKRATRAGLSTSSSRRSGNFPSGEQRESKNIWKYLKRRRYRNYSDMSNTDPQRMYKKYLLGRGRAEMVKFLNGVVI